MVEDLIGGIIDLIVEFFWIRFKRGRIRRQEWHGTVKRKKAPRGHSLAKYGSAVYFRKEDGRRIKLKMTKADSALYHEGKTYHKRSGEDLPDPETAA